MLGLSLLVAFGAAAVWVPSLGWRSGVDGPVITSSRDFFGEQTLSSGIRGPLSIDDRCVYIGEPAVPVVFQAGTGWDEIAEAIVIGGERLQDGGYVSGAGSLLSGEDLRVAVGDRAFEAAQRCLADTDASALGVEAKSAAVFDRSSFPFTRGQVDVLATNAEDPGHEVPIEFGQYQVDPNNERTLLLDNEVWWPDTMTAEVMETEDSVTVTITRQRPVIPVPLPVTSFPEPAPGEDLCNFEPALSNELVLDEALAGRTVIDGHTGEPARRFWRDATVENCPLQE